MREAGPWGVFAFPRPGIENAPLASRDVINVSGERREQQQVPAVM